MKITRDNYEIWFLDYQEGRLDMENEKEVQKFLYNNPDLAEELAAFTPVLNYDSHVLFPTKDRLKREQFDDPAYFETTALAAMEGDLSEDEIYLLEKWMTKNTSKQEFMSQLKNTKLQADLRLSFPGRDCLRKKTTLTALWVKITAVAASLLLAIFLFYPEKKNLPINNIITQSVSPKEVMSSPKAGSGTNQVVTSIVKNKPIQVIYYKYNKAKVKNPDAEFIINRQPIVIETLQPKTSSVNSLLPTSTDLALIKINDPVYASTNDIPLSDFLKSKLQTMKTPGPKWFFTREEVTIAGLRLFSRLPGNHLTGKKGTNGKLKSISFDTKLLAFSIPVNR